MKSPVLLAILAAGPVASQATVVPGAKALHRIAVSTNTGMKPMADNPFLHPSPLPYELPPFDQIKGSDYLPAFEAGMREHRREVDAIVRDHGPATFENTIVALERSGQLLERVNTFFSNLNAANSDPEMDKIDTEMTPRLTAHDDAILLDSALYARVDSLFERRASLKLDPESLQLLERYHVMFVRAGAKLSEPDKARLRAINESISSLMTQFKQNVLKATNEGAVVVVDVKELDGLSPEQIGAAERAAAARGLNGKYLITLQNTTNQPSLARLKNRALRERIYEASIARCNGRDADNNPVIAQMVKLRAERAKLLGYPNYAAYQLEDESAGTPAAVHDILIHLVPAALASAERDAAEMQKLIDAEAARTHTPSFKLQPWDWAFYAEALRKARYDFDEAQVAPYFELDHVLHDGVFYAANHLYGLTFKERKDLPVYQADVRIFEVFDRNGAPLALFLGDYFARDNKRGGAWMDSLVRQSQLFGRKPVVTNTLNIPKPQPGRPTLLTFDEVTTLFHEFGHAVHGMLSNVRYPLLSGTSVPRDFVEFPSQYNEMWAREPMVLANFAKHYQTGAPMPQELLSKVMAAQKFNQGYATTEYLAAALLDQEWHLITPAQAPAAADVLAFEVAALRKNGIDYAQVQPRYHSGYFSHIFAGGYASGYYAYLWSEVLARDTGQWMHQHGGLTRANGDYLRDKILSRGRTEDPQAMFKNFYGRAPDIGPLIEYRGLTVPEVSAPAAAAGGN
jgi:peptidyl-dipeptidase Dcp